MLISRIVSFYGPVGQKYEHIRFTKNNYRSYWMQQITLILDLDNIYDETIWKDESILNLEPDKNTMIFDDDKPFDIGYFSCIPDIGNPEERYNFFKEFIDERPIYAALLDFEEKMAIDIQAEGRDLCCGHIRTQRIANNDIFFVSEEFEKLRQEFTTRAIKLSMINDRTNIVQSETSQDSQDLLFDDSSQDEEINDSNSGS